MCKGYFNWMMKLGGVVRVDGECWVCGRCIYEWRGENGEGRRIRVWDRNMGGIGKERGEGGE